MVKEHEDELGTTENQTKMDSIQLRFPNDDLQLNDEKQQVGFHGNGKLIQNGGTVNRGLGKKLII